MNDLEERLRQRDTSDLQRALYRNELTSEAAPLAAKILRERGEDVPDPMTQGAVDAEEREVLRRSNLKFLVFVLTIIGWFAYAITFDLFEPGNGKSLQHSLFYTGLLLAIEFGWIKLR